MEKEENKTATPKEQVQNIIGFIGKSEEALQRQRSMINQLYAQLRIIEKFEKELAEGKTVFYKLHGVNTEWRPKPAAEVYDFDRFSYESRESHKNQCRPDATDKINCAKMVGRAVTHKESNVSALIVRYDPKDEVFAIAWLALKYSIKELFENFTWADGTPIGIEIE